MLIIREQNIQRSKNDGNQQRATSAEQKWNNWATTGRRGGRGRNDKKQRVPVTLKFTLNVAK